MNSGPEICMETELPPGKYNAFVNPCITDFISYNTYNAGACCKEVTLKNHSNNGLAILHGIFLPRKYDD